MILFQQVFSWDVKRRKFGEDEIALWRELAFERTDGPI